MDRASRLHDEYRPLMLAVARQRGCSATDAEDIVQDVWLRIVRRGHLVRLLTLSEPHQRHWLAQAVVHRVCSFRRDATAQCRDSRLQISIDDAGAMPLTASDPSEDLDHAWLQQRIEAALITLRIRSRSPDWPQIEAILRDDHQPNGDRLPNRIRAALCRARRELRCLAFDIG